MPTSTDTTTEETTETEPVEATIATEILWIDPNDLLDNPDNPRTDLGRLTGLRDSMAEVGVLQALRVLDTPEGFVIHAGHRRKHAAIAAEIAEVPCVVVEGDVARGEVIAGALAENGARDELSTGDKVAAVRQLALDEGWSASRIQRATGAKRSEVKGLVAVASNDTAAAVVARFAGVTLDQAQVIASFEDDPEAVKTLTIAAEKSPGQFDHLASRMQHDRDYQQAYDNSVEALTAEGVTLYDSDDHPNAVVLGRLVDADGAAIEVTDHTECGGHAATVDQYDPDQIVYLCTDPAAHGHRDRWANTSSGGAKGGKMTDEQKAERREVIANNKAAEAAKPVRMAYLARLLARKTPPAGTLRFVTWVLLVRPTIATDVHEERIAAVLGTEPEGTSYGASDTALRLLTDATDKRLALVALTTIAAGIEATMDRGFWRHGSDVHAAYLNYLASTGYELSEVEQISADTHTDEAA